MDCSLRHSTPEPIRQPQHYNCSTTVAQGPRSVLYNDTIHMASTMDGTYTRVKKRGAQAMDSDTSSSRKRQRTGRGFVGQEAKDTAQKTADLGSSAEDLYMDVRDGARSPPEDRTVSALDVSKIECVRVKRSVARPTPAGFHNTNHPLCKNQLSASSLDKNRHPSNKLAGRILRKMASKYETPSTPLARIGRLEDQPNQGLADNLPPKQADDTPTRAHDSLEHAPALIRSSSCTQHHQNKAPASRQQPVEHARPTRRWSSDASTRRSQLDDSDVKTKDTAMDAERNTLHLELDRLSQGLTPQSVHNVRYILFMVSNKANFQHSLDYSGLIERSTTLSPFGILRSRLFNSLQHCILSGTLSRIRLRS